MKTIGQRTKRTTARICIAISFVILAAVVIFPAFRHYLPAGGWFTVASSAMGILGGVVYLSSTQDGAR